MNFFNIIIIGKKTAILCFAMSILFLISGFHNIDLAYNMDSKCIDINNFGYTQSKSRLYFNGMTMFELAILLQIISFLLIV